MEDEDLNTMADEDLDGINRLKKATDDAKATQKTLALVGMHQQESQLPAGGTAPAPIAPPAGGAAPASQQQMAPAYPGTPAPVGPAYEFGRGIGVLKPPATPAQQGRSYMGPALSPEAEQNFMRMPPGTRINLLPPPTPQQAAGAAGRVAAATKPAPDPRLTAIDGGDQFAARQGYQNAIAQGMDPSAAAAAFLPMALRGQTQRPIPRPRLYNVPNVGLVDDKGKIVRAAGPKQFAPPRTSKLNRNAEDAAAAKNAATEPVPKDPKQRKIGNVYDTPKGKFRWLGNGWKAVQ